MRGCERNARRDLRKQLKTPCSSLTTLGWATPLIVGETGMMLCGAGRLEAAGRLGMAQVPAIAQSHMSEADTRAFIVADAVDDVAFERSVAKAQRSPPVRRGAFRCPAAAVRRTCGGIRG